MAAHLRMPYRSIFTQDQGVTMKSRIAGLLILMLIVGSTHAGDIFETGILKDEIGYQDGKGSKVAFITPMMGWKDPVTGKTKWTWQAFVIDIPIETSNVRKIEAFSIHGESLEFGMEPNYWEGDKFVKLWIVKDPGYEFKIRITFDN